MLLKAPNNSGGFVTSDHPSCLSWSHGPPDNLGMGPGLASKGSGLLLPVSRRLALFGSFEIEDGEGEANEDLVARFNSQVIRRSSWQVYAHDVHFSYWFGDQIRKGSETGDRKCVHQTSREVVGIAFIIPYLFKAPASYL